MNEINHSERDHALLSASSAHRWLNCPPSAVAAEAYPSQDTEYTREGTLAHEVAEVVARQTLAGGKDVSDTYKEAITHEMIDCANEYAAYIQEQLKSDDAVVLLEQRVDFSPWVPNGFGTCDCIILQGDTLIIIDYKYGQGVAVSAVDNPQMKLYALGALNDYGLAYEVTNVETHIFQPRLNNVSADRMTVGVLEKWGEGIKPTAQKAAKGKGNYKPGEHCRFCPHAGKCRSLTKICTQYVETHNLRVGVQTLAPFEVADVLRMAPLIELWLKKVKDQALTSLLNGETVPGYKVVEGRGSRSWADEGKVKETLTAAGYSLDTITETKLYSPAVMEKKIGKKKAAELLEELVDRRAGAPTIAPETDRRPVYDRLAEAKKDFED